MQNEGLIQHSDEIYIPAQPPSAVEPTPNDPPWGVLESIGVWIASVLFILIFPAIVLLPYLATQRGAFVGNEELLEFAKTDPTSVFLQIVAILPAHLATVLIAWLVVTRVRKYRFRETLGWENGGFKWWHHAVLLGAFFGVAIIVNTFVPEKENDLVKMLQSSRAAVYIIAFVATFTAPFVEELVYRGMLYSAFQRRIGVPSAFILVTLLFAFVHVPQYYPSYSTIFLLTLLSLTLTAIRVWSKNLWPCIVLHTVFNGIQSIFLIVLPEQAPKTDVPEQVAAIMRFLNLG